MEAMLAVCKTHSIEMDATTSGTLQQSLNKLRAVSACGSLQLSDAASRTLYKLHEVSS